MKPSRIVCLSILPLSIAFLIGDVSGELHHSATGLSVQGPRKTFKLYLSADGYESNTGRSPMSPVPTLAHVQAILLSEGFHKPTWAATRDADVEVHIDASGGVFFGESIEWTATNANYHISFLPKDYGTIRPVFSGCSDATETICALERFFRVTKSEPTNVHFSSIHVRRYGNGIEFKSFEGNTSNSSNSIVNSQFEAFGSYYTTSEFGWTFDHGIQVIGLQNSDRNFIDSNTFIGARNSPTGLFQLHQLYVAHGSDMNLITNNSFENSRGAALKFRNRSDYNRVENNAFIKDGRSRAQGPRDAGYTEALSGDELSSCENTFRYNRLDGTWDCNHTLIAFTFYEQPDNRCAAQRQQRLHTWSNWQTARPCLSGPTR